MLSARCNRGDEYMPFGFDRRKAIQAVAFLLKQRPERRDSYGRLLKVLYIADRESIKETGTPITGDRFVAMEHGTMLSHLYDLAARKVSSQILAGSDHREWNKYITPIGAHVIRLIADPGDGALCEYEVKKLNEVADRYRDYTFGDMKNVTHNLPEYHDPGKTSKLISLRDFLCAVGMGGAADGIIEEAKHSASLARLLRR